MALNGAYENRKTRRLARALGAEPWAALGLLEAFWAWVRRAARDGRIDGDQWEDVADYLQWRKPADELRQLLEDAKFVDDMGGWSWVHDWDEHADDTTRKALERSGKNFANGSPTRRWQKGDSPKPHESSPEVHRNEEKVRVTASAGPEPEPEPVPVPDIAAAARVPESSAALPAATPPPLSEREGAEIANLLQTAMPRGFRSCRDDRNLLLRIKAAMQGATLAELAAALVQFRRTRKPPDGYGFWPDYLRSVLAPESRASLGAIAVPAEPPPAPKAPICVRCHGRGVVGRRVDESAPGAIRAAIRAGGALCECEIGESWREYFAMDEDGDVDGLPSIQREARAVAVAV